MGSASCCYDQGERVTDQAHSEALLVQKQGAAAGDVDSALRLVAPGEFSGIQIDGNGRFLLGDFTITHNTTVTRLARRIGEATGFFASTVHRLLEYSRCSAGSPATGTDMLVIDP